MLRALRVPGKGQTLGKPDYAQSGQGGGEIDVHMESSLGRSTTEKGKGRFIPKNPNTRQKYKYKRIL